MKTSTVGNLKTHFSEVLNDVQNGEEYTIEFGKQHNKVAVIIPYSKYVKKNKRKIGILENKGKIIIKNNFKMTDDEFLNS